MYLWIRSSSVSRRSSTSREISVFKVSSISSQQICLLHLSKRSAFSLRASLIKQDDTGDEIKFTVWNTVLIENNCIERRFWGGISEVLLDFSGGGFLHGLVHHLMNELGAERAAELSQEGLVLLPPPSKNTQEKEPRMSKTASVTSNTRLG